MRSPDIEDLQLLDLSAAAPAYVPLSAPDGAVWPRAAIRFHEGWWTAKVWKLPGVPARRKGLLLAGMYSSRVAAFKYAQQQVGILRMGQNLDSGGWTKAGQFSVDEDYVGYHPKGEAPC